MSTFDGAIEEVAIRWEEHRAAPPDQFKFGDAVARVGLRRRAVLSARHLPGERWRPIVATRCWTPRA